MRYHIDASIFLNPFSVARRRVSWALKGHLWTLLDQRMRLVSRQNDELNEIAAYPLKLVLMYGKSAIP